MFKVFSQWVVNQTEKYVVKYILLLWFGIILAVKLVVVMACG